MAERRILTDADLDFWIEVRTHLQTDAFSADCGLHCHHITYTR